jgi:hypothetical protein
MLIFVGLFWANVQSKRTTRAEPEDHLWSADHSLRNAAVEHSAVADALKTHITTATTTLLRNWRQTDVQLRRLRWQHVILHVKRTLITIDLLFTCFRPLDFIGSNVYSHLYPKSFNSHITYTDSFLKYTFIVICSVVWWGNEIAWKVSQRTGLWYTSSRVQTPPKPSDFSGVKFLSMPSFGGEVKPSVPCRRFAAC